MGETRDYSAIVGLNDWPNEEDENYAMRVLRARYKRGVTERATEYVKLLRAGDFDDADAFNDRMWEDIDGCEDVTAKAATVGFVSRFDWQDVWAEIGGGKAPTTEEIAFLCLKGDVLAEVESQLGDDVQTFSLRSQMGR